MRGLWSDAKIIFVLFVVCCLISEATGVQLDRWPWGIIGALSLGFFCLVQLMRLEQSIGETNRHLRAIAERLRQTEQWRA
jgi:hypothetical protein